jgi:hypothetical protein
MACVPMYPMNFAVFKKRMVELLFTHIRDFAKIFNYSNAIIILVCVKLQLIKHVLE